MNINSNLSKKSFAIYGLGATGRSVINYFRENNFKNYIVWDDNYKVIKKFYGKKFKNKRNNFLNFINIVDYIIISPGISLKKSKNKKILLRNKDKIITDLDLFFLINPKVRSIVVTGTNGKSTTCKIIDHLLKKNRINVRLGGNIGEPVLTLKVKENSLIIIEASSFQLAYSKFIRPKYAILLNISNDHLDWHGSMSNYIKSKFKIFSLQKKDDFAFLNNKKFFNIFVKKKYSSNLKLVKLDKYKTIKNKIKNNYLNSIANDENMSFVFALSKILKITNESFIKSMQSFKGLPHRYEIFYKKGNIIFINDSKATTFEASKFALQDNSNIFWIVGGLPKKKDKFKLGKLKKNIIKAYIIGKHMRIFKKSLAGKVNFELSKNLKKALISIFLDIKKEEKEIITVLLSPASASYDQFSNFEERGDTFKKIVKNYARRYIK